ncbi:MAG: type II secretion system F family protein [Limnobacter sp.]|uniref:type II secretion system F family protein n=1 Tax=Limnobacter sp. TaxID=2003368 RepID=UPI00391DBDA3
MPTATRARTGSTEQTFAWTETTRDRKRKPRQGEIRARSEQHAMAQLGRQGIRSARVRKVRKSGTTGIKQVQICAFVRQLAVMTQSGVPLAQSLGLIGGNLTGRSKAGIRELVRTLRTDVESGIKLSDAFRKHPKHFDNLFCNTLAAGEHAGELDSTLNRLAIHLEKAQRIKQRLRKAMVYPGIVIVVASLVTVGMLTYVLPSFRSVYAQFKADMPALTTMLLNLSDVLVNHGPWVAGGVIAGLVSLHQAYKRLPRFKDACDQVMLRIPVLGELIRTAMNARWTRTFSTLSASGVPVTDALESVALVSTIRSFEVATREVRQAVASGSTISDGMELQGVFPQDSIQMIRIGEESGRLDEMMQRLADQYEVKLDDQVDTLSTIMEPAIMCVIGGLIGVLIIGMYLPIFNIGGIV